MREKPSWIERIVVRIFATASLSVSLCRSFRRCLVESTPSRLCSLMPIPFLQTAWIEVPRCSRCPATAVGWWSF